MDSAMDLDKGAPVVESVAVATGTDDSPRLEAGGTATKEANSVASQTMLERLLAMAQRYRKEGNYRQTTELFWMLVEEHSETPQADAAKAELLALAGGYERAGNQHMARSMYERLLDLED